MTTSTTITGVPFSVESAEPRPSLATLRIRFTNDPQQSNPAISTDGLNPANYTLSGPVVIAVLSVGVVPDDPQSLDLALAAPLAVGSWTVTVANVETAFADPLLSPAFATFIVTIGANTEAVNQGATNDTAEAVLRKNLSSAFVGPFWDAIVAALATGDKRNWDNARSIFDQLFLSSASGKYLDQRAADVGLSRPVDVGLSDAQFRDLAIKITAGKLTAESLYEILEVFYGPEATRGSVTTDLYEPFSLVDGLTLDVLIDEVDSVRIIFSEDDFVQVGQAKALEVAAAITRSFRNQNLKAWAETFIDPETGSTKVRIYSPSLGLGSSVRVTGGSVQNNLRFPQILLTNGADSGVVVGENWAVTVPSLGTMRLTISGSASVDLSGVQEGDYLNLYGAGFNTLNRGSFQITAVDVRYTGGPLVQYVEVANDFAIAETPITTVLTSDLVFFRPFKGAISSGTRTVVVCQGATNLLDIVLPATSLAVQRKALEAAYLHSRDAIQASSLSRDVDGVVSVGFSSPHGLNAGEWIFVDGVIPTSTMPPTTLGNATSTTDTNLFAHWNQDLGSSIGSFSDFTPISVGNKVYILGGVDNSNSPAGITSYFEINSQSGSPVQYTFQQDVFSGGAWDGEGGQITVLPDGEFLITGGTTTSLDATWLFDPGTEEWVSGSVMYNSRRGHRQSLVAGGKVVVSGGTTIGTECELFELTGTGAGTWYALANTTIARSYHNQITLQDGRVLIVGGVDAGGLTGRTAVAELINATTGVVTTSGAMSYSRWNSGQVLLPDGRVLIVGGQGFVASSPTASNTPLATAEIWDPNTGRWYPAGSMSVPRVYPQVHYLPDLDKVLVFGGNGAGSEFYDVKTGKWEDTPFKNSTLDVLTKQGSALLENGTVLTVGGVSSTSGLTVQTETLWIPGELAFKPAKINGQLFQIKTTPNPLSLTFDSTPGYIVGSGVISVTPATAIASDSGPYIYDPDAGVSITGTETTTTQRLSKGQQYVSIPVTDSSQFPDEDGWICLGFGTASSQKFKYRGRFSATALAIDAGYRFTQTLPSGTTVTLLQGSGPYVPDAPQDVGSFYLTASAAGRVAAEQSVRSALASGGSVGVRVVYPGDTGLGGAGLPTVNADKLSDVVGVFAGNDEDAEIAAAKVGG